MPYSISPSAKSSLGIIAETKENSLLVSKKPSVDVDPNLRGLKNVTIEEIEKDDESSCPKILRLQKVPNGKHSSIPVVDINSDLSNYKAEVSPKAPAEAGDEEGSEQH